MTAALNLLAFAIALLALALASFYALIVVVGAWPKKRPYTLKTPGPIAVIVPAHDEEAGVAQTIADLKGQLRSGDRLLVVADNCADRTAEVARAAGAIVVERHDAARRGKGYALQFGLDALRDDPPEIAFIVDADCRVAPGAILDIAAVAAGSGRPAQALYLMTQPAGAGPTGAGPRAVAEFAWLLMNKVRQAGLAALFDVTRLTGSGMAFPWTLLATRDLASGEIVEDMALALDLTQAGAAPILVSQAIVRSEFPTSQIAAARQRARWEHGSMRLAARRAPGLLLKAIASADLRLAALALDVMIPPLTIFIAALTGLWALSLLAALLGMPLAAPIAAMALGLVSIAILLAWARHGREALPLGDLGALTSYILGKRAVYGKDARRSAKVWTRTERGDGEQAKGP